MTHFTRRFFSLALSLVASGPGWAAADWRIEDRSPAQAVDAPFVHQRKIVFREGPSGREEAGRIDLAWFDAATHRFAVIDNGGEAGPRYGGLADAMVQTGARAGCNGGFFHPDFSPSGLMIAGGTATGRFGQGSLLSGVILTSGRGNSYLLRRGEYDPDKYRATELIQAGPFLVDRGATVRGLSPEKSRRRTLVLHDGKRGFALGLSDPFTLAELGEILAREDFSPGRPIHRALNLDGGTSSGFFLDRGSLGEPLALEPVKSVRNFLAVVPRDRN